MDATELLRQLKGRFPEVVFDDFSHLCEKTFSVLEQKLEGKRGGYAAWGAMRDAAIAFREAARYARLDVIANAWEQSPKIKDGQKVRGGPQLSGKLPESVPALCDTVLRAMYEPARKPWPVVYRCSADPNYVMKDRLDVAIKCDPAPMNLGELLRASTIVRNRSRGVPARHSDLPKQEEQVEALSRDLSGMQTDEDMNIANVAFQALIENGMTHSAARWTVRDALDRASIRYALQNTNQSFFALSTNKHLG
jgi:hypothetical protein